MMRLQTEKWNHTKPNQTNQNKSNEWYKTLHLKKSFPNLSATSQVLSSQKKSSTDPYFVHMRALQLSFVLHFLSLFSTCSIEYVWFYIPALSFLWFFFSYVVVKKVQCGCSRIYSKPLYFQYIKFKVNFHMVHIIFGRWIGTKKC